MASNQGHEQRFWSSFKTAHTFELFGSAASLAGVPKVSSSGYDDTLLASTGGSLRVYNLRSLKLVRSLSKGVKGSVFGCDVHANGRLAACGTSDGHIVVYDLQKNMLLRKMKNGHGGKHVHAVRFIAPSSSASSASGAAVGTNELVTCGDDGVVKIWDVGLGKSTMRFEGHTDYVRCVATADGRIGDMMAAGAPADDHAGIEDAAAAALPMSLGPGSSGGAHAGNVAGGLGTLIASGSYDHTVRLWDPRMGNAGTATKSVFTLQHSHPVLNLMFLPGNGLLATAAGTGLCVWNLFTGRMISMNNTPQKAVTSIALIITALVTPFEVSFLEPGGVDALFVMNRLIDVTFLADMALRMPVWGSNADCAKNLLLTHVSGPRVGNRFFPDVPGRAGGQC